MFRIYFILPNLRKIRFSCKICLRHLWKLTQHSSNRVTKLTTSICIHSSWTFSKTIWAKVLKASLTSNNSTQHRFNTKTKILIWNRATKRVVHRLDPHKIHTIPWLLNSRLSIIGHLRTWHKNKKIFFSHIQVMNLQYRIVDGTTIEVVNLLLVVYPIVIKTIMDWIISNLILTTLKILKFLR